MKNGINTHDNYMEHDDNCIHNQQISLTIYITSIKYKNTAKRIFTSSFVKKTSSKINPKTWGKSGQNHLFLTQFSHRKKCYRDILHTLLKSPLPLFIYGIFTFLLSLLVLSLQLIKVNRKFTQKSIRWQFLKYLKNGKS